MPRKDPLTLVEAVQRLPESQRACILICFLGSGELHGRVEQACAGGPAIRARFPGFINQKNLSAYYHAADLLVLPSVREETWGLVVNEALGHGVPAAVSSAVGCAPDLIVPGRTGGVFRAGDPSELTALLARLLPATGTEQVRFDCRARVARYSVQAAAEGIAAAFRASNLQPPLRSES